MIYIRDFKTQASETFQDPRSHIDDADMLEDAIEGERIEWESKRKEEREAAVGKLGHMAKSNFGNMSNMMRTFKKNTGDTITLPEFSEHLRRRKLDKYLPVEEQELVFEQLKASARGSVNAGILSQTVDATIGEDAAPMDEGEAAEIRQFLEESIKEAREKKSREGEEQKERAVVAGGDDLMRKAISQKSYGMNVGAEEMDNVMDDLFHKKHTQKSHGKFSRYLRLTNLNLKAIPFYDLRSDQLDNMKKHAVDIEKIASSPSVAGRLAVLKEQRRHQVESDLHIHDNYHAHVEHEREYGQSSGASRMYSANDEGESGRGDDFERTSTASIPESRSGSYIGTAFDSKLSAAKGASQFGPATPFSPIKPYELTAAATLGGDLDDSMYNSTYSEYFPPLRYETNKPVTRDNLGDADAKIQQRNQRRARRAERTQKNLQVTSDRLELQKLDNLARQLRRSQSVNEDQIRYQSTIFLHDLKCYKKQPLTRMSRKPNLTKSDRMWGGQMSFESKGKEKAIDSELSTTFRESFSGAQNNHANIDIESKINRMFSQ